MSCQMDDIGCTEENATIEGNIVNPQLKGRALVIDKKWHYFMWVELDCGHSMLGESLLGDEKGRAEEGGSIHVPSP